MIHVGSTLPPPPLWAGWELGSVSLAQLVCKAVSRSYGCKSKYEVRNKLRDHTRSIPPFHTPGPYLLEGSVPYLCSIPLIHTLWYIYIFIYIYICIYLNMCSLILHLYAHTWAHIHTWVFTCKNTFTMPKPCDCVGKSVPAAFVVWW